jgi:hypothetical protein
LSSTDNVKYLDISISRRTSPKSGPMSSDAINDMFDEVVRDFTEFARQWNDGVVSFFSAVPTGGEDSAIDAIANGLDGRNLYVDSSVTSTSTPLTYYSASASRPSTIREALDTLYSYVDTTATSIRNDVTSTTGALSAAEKARIGDNIFDSTATSLATSLDGLSENSRLNIIQIAQDLYGPTYALGNDGATDLDNPVQGMVDALLQAHGGSWSSDITLTHSGITVAQTDVPQSASVDDTFTGVPTTLEDDLNEIRTQIKENAGTAAWTGTLPALYAGGPDTTFDLLTAAGGSGTKAASNPWGYHYQDVDALEPSIDARVSFVGQADHLEPSPTYHNTYLIQTGQDLQTAMGVADSGIQWAATPGLANHLGDEFRRLETAVAGSGAIITHNKGAYPQNSLVMIDPPATTSGEVLWYTHHIDQNEFYMVVPSGMITSAILVSTW